MQVLEIFFDVSAAAAAIGAGAALFQTRGRLRSAEAKRNALQSRLTELEQQRVTAATEEDATFAAVQSSNQRLLETAHQRVAELENALQSAEKQRTLSAQRVETLEKNLAQEKSKVIRLETPPTPAPSAPPTPAPVEVTETPAPAVRLAVATPKKAANTLLMAASRESKTANDMEKQLIEAGYKVVRATSVENVIKAAQESRPDLITLDMQLSGGDTLEALEKVKADPDLRDIPVVVVCNLKDRDKAIEMGAAGCVAPPVTANVLLGTVKTAFINHRKRVERSRLAKTANTGSTDTPQFAAVNGGIPVAAAEK